MGPETNIDSIRALEKQIEEGKGDIIQLKHARNSLLNISTRVPPEILGCVFGWNLVQEADYSLDSPSNFAGLRKGSYNFLLVCNHWFEVASGTPELWSFWGNTLQDWEKRHDHPGATPLDLVLSGDESDPAVLFDETLQDAVRNHVMQDMIRQIHLVSDDYHTLTSIISSLTPEDEGSQNDNVGSIIWLYGGEPPVEVSNFFSRSHLSRLRLLELSGNFWISSWDWLASRITLLTTLSLGVSTFSPSPTVTTYQLYSILTSNPNLRELRLSNTALPNDTDPSTSKVQLHKLKILFLAGEFRHLFGLLSRFILPGALDEMHLDVSNTTVEDISQILGPYIRDYFQRDPRFQDRLGMHSSSYGSLSISVGIVHTQTTPSVRHLPRVTLVAQADLPPDELEQLFISLAVLIPLERVVSLDTNGDTQLLPEDLLCMMPHIEVLRISYPKLSEGFLQPNPDGPHATTKLLPSLRLLRLEYVIFLDNDGWDHLATYLAHQALDGQAISFQMIGHIPRMCPEVVNRTKDLVKEFTHHRNEWVVEDE